MTADPGTASFPHLLSPLKGATGDEIVSGCPAAGAGRYFVLRSPRSRLANIAGLIICRAS
jgi:hypothetical protein